MVQQRRGELLVVGMVSAVDYRVSYYNRKDLVASAKRLATHSELISEEQFPEWSSSLVRGVKILIIGIAPIDRTSSEASKAHACFENNYQERERSRNDHFSPAQRCRCRNAAS
jgi:hypothetical protein